MEHREPVYIDHLVPENAATVFSAVLDRFAEGFKSPVTTVAIKINVCDYRLADSGAVTDPEQLAALLDVLHARFPGARMLILENNATSVDMDSAFRLLGYSRIADEHGAQLHNAAKHDWVTKPVPNGIVFPQLDVPAILDECDLFINFAKLKTNALTKTTGCLKNIFALLRQKRKVDLHGRIDQVLLDMNRVIVPDLCLIDGYIGMEGMGGPAFGKPKRCELLLSGRNPVATDACEARVMGFRPLSIGHIKLCHKAGLGPVDYELKTSIADFNYARYKFQFEHMDYRLRNMLRSRVGIAT